MSQKGKVHTASGLFSNNQGVGLNLREALDELGKCCGFDCCSNTIRINDQETGDLVEVYFEDGDLKFSIGGTTYTVTATSDQG